MRKFYGFYSLLFTMMILIITTSAGAFFPGDGKGVYEGDRQPGIKADGPFLKASTPRSGREAVPEGLTKRAWETIRASIERDGYRMYKDEHTDAFQAPNYAHDLHATFTQEGVELRPRKGKKGWKWGLRLSKYGYGSDLHSVTVAEKMLPRDNRIAYLRGNMVEWYINDHRGLEQGFTLKARPSGRMGSEPLYLHMHTTGNLIPVVEKEGKGIVFRNTHGKEIVRYSGLSAYDATGKTLYARMEADQEGIRLIVEDHTAVYPITIDPFIETKKLLASDGAAEDYFGYSVSIIGDTAIVGAYLDDDNGSDSGSAYIFSRNHGGTDNWGEVKKLLASDGAAYKHFGWSVSIIGDTAIVGAWGDNDSGHSAGSSYIFSRNHGGTDNWGEVTKLLASDGAAGDYFGYSVSISGDSSIVGAYGDDDNGDYSGSAYIFSRDYGGANTWGEVTKLLASDGAAEDYFGYSVSISGDTAIVGARVDDDNGTDSGSAYIFSRDHGGTDNWGEVTKLLASDGFDNDYFGTSVSISGDTAIVGAHGDDDNGGLSGSAYIFSRNHGGTDNWGEVTKLLASDGAIEDWFGRSVSISGDTAIVGAHKDDDNGENSGSAYIFSYVFGDELAVDFGGNGLWHYDGSTLTQLNGQSPDGMEAWNGGLAGDFDGNGLWTFNGSSWALLTTLNPDSMEAWDSSLAVYFPGNGLWSYDGATWSLLTTNTAEDMQSWTGGIAVDFGTFGLWNYNGSSWSLLTTSNAEGMESWTNGLSVDFGSFGLWNYNGSSWTLLTTNNPEGMQAWSGGLSVDFGSFGLWNYNGSSWSLLTTSNASSMADWSGGVAVNFSSGLWTYDGSSWDLLTTINPEDLEGWATSLAADLGTFGLWNYNGAAWSQLTGWNAEDMVDVDVY
jgi:hypothetical protein